MMRVDDRLLAAAAREIADHLRAALDNPAAQTVCLGREQALLTLGLIDGLADQLDPPTAS